MCPELLNPTPVESMRLARPLLLDTCMHFPRVLLLGKKTDETFEACNSLMGFEPASTALGDSLGRGATSPSDDLYGRPAYLMFEC